ncbi:MAG: hypothetical protein JNN29_11285 [Chitinophagaceae bacterium]|nr:hypothetical protein [Chitinophagaceae bacterium]MBN8667692.1 hypothetical protein [Chitinophagales bacterium]
MTWNAVITADIVNSTKLSATAIKKLNGRIEEVLKPHQHEYYRGDSFQVYIADAAQALPMIVQLRLLARQFSAGIPRIDSDIRSAIGIGQIKEPVKDLTRATDELFILSGRALDALDQEEDRFTMISRNEKANIALRLIAQFIDQLIGNMTLKQGQVVIELLKGQTQTETAKKLKKTQVTVHRQAHAAGWKSINRLLKEYEIVLNQFDLS